MHCNWLFAVFNHWLATESIRMLPVSSKLAYILNHKIQYLKISNTMEKRTTADPNQDRHKACSYSYTSVAFEVFEHFLKLASGDEAIQNNSK